MDQSRTTINMEEPFITRTVDDNDPPLCHASISFVHCNAANISIVLHQNILPLSLHRLVVQLESSLFQVSELALCIMCEDEGGEGR